MKTSPTNGFGGIARDIRLHQSFAGSAIGDFA